MKCEKFFTKSKVVYNYGNGKIEYSVYLNI